MTPLIAALGAGGAAGGAAAAGTGLAQAATLFSAGSSIAGGISAYGQAQGEKQRAENNAFIGRTRAMQADVSARQGLDEELAQVRAVLGANGQGLNVGTEDGVFTAIRRARGRERRIDYGNEMQGAADQRMAARNIRPGGALIGGFSRAAPSLFEYAQLRRA